jgi:hypothetical protein
VYHGYDGKVKMRAIVWEEQAVRPDSGLVPRKRFPYFFPVQGSDMLRVNEFQLYELATSIHPLTMVDQGAKYSEVWLDWFNAKQALQNLFKQRSLEVCFETANQLYAALKVVVPDDFDEAVSMVPVPDASLEETSIGWPAYAIKSAAEKFETVIAAELSNSDTY